MAGPYSITISPVGFDAKPGQIVVMTVTDSGTRPITVNSLPSILTDVTGSKDKCKLIPAPRQLTVSPARFTLKPGESRRATITVNKNANAHLAIVFYATEKTSKNLRVNAGAAGQITTTGKPLQCSPVTIHKKVIPVGAVIGGSAGLIILGLVLWAVIFRRRNTRHTPGRRRAPRPGRTLPRGIPGPVSSGMGSVR